MRKLVQEKMADAMQMPNQNSIHIVWLITQQVSTSSRPTSTPSQGKSCKIASRMNRLINKTNSKPTKVKRKKSLRLHIRWIREDAGRNRKIAKHVNGGRQPFVFFEVGEVDITIHTFPNSTLLGRVLMTLPTVMTLLNLNLFLIIIQAELCLKGAFVKVSFIFVTIYLDKKMKKLCHFFSLFH